MSALLVLLSIAGCDRVPAPPDEQDRQPYERAWMALTEEVGEGLVVHPDHVLLGEGASLPGDRPSHYEQGGRDVAEALSGSGAIMCEPVEQSGCPSEVRSWVALSRPAEGEDGAFIVWATHTLRGESWTEITYYRVVIGRDGDVTLEGLFAETAGR